MDGDRLLKNRHVYPLLFFVGALLRGFPEAIVAKYPVGYDTTAHYPFNILNFNKLDFGEMLLQAPLFYIIAHASIQLPGVDVFAFLKTAGPILYGMLCASFYFLLKNAVGWRDKTAPFGALIFELQVVTLRLSWDMFRLELGLILMFTTLGLLVRKSSRTDYLVASLTVATVLAHQIASLIFFFSSFWFVIRRTRLRKKFLSSLTPLLPGGILFILVLYATLYIPPPTDPRIMSTGPSGHFLSYFEIDPRLLEGSYFIIARNIGMLMLFCYGLILPFIIKGFKRNEILDPVLVMLLLGSFSPLIVPFMSFPAVYWRWILLLVIPFAAYAACGLVKLKRVWRKRAIGVWLILLFFMSLSFGYASGTLPLRSMYFQLKGETPKAPSPNKISYGIIESVNTYVPVGLVASSTSVGDVTSVIDDCIASLEWLDKNAPSESCLLTEERFTSWARLHTSNEIKLAIYGGLTPVNKILEEIESHEFTHIYMIWYSDVQIEEFKEAYRHDTIAIYEYK